MPNSYRKILYGNNLRKEANLDAGGNVESVIRKAPNTCLREESKREADHSLKARLSQTICFFHALWVSLLAITKSHKQGA